MPIINNNIPPAQIPAGGNTTPPHEVIDTASIYTGKGWNPVYTANIEGYPWTVNYYNRYLGEDDVVSNSSDNIDPSIKQYSKIRDMELRVTVPLTPEYDATTGTTTITGEANMYGVIAPIKGDPFIGLIENGVSAAFEIKTVKLNSMYKGGAWSVTYAQIDYVTESVVAANYDAFVIDEFIFDVSLLQSSSYPLKTLSEYNRSIHKADLINELITRYYNEFYFIEVKTFIAPSTLVGSFLYDPNVTTFWNRHIDSRPLLFQQPQEYEVNEFATLSKFYTIYDAITNQAPWMLNGLIKKMDRVPSARFFSIYVKSSIMNKGIDAVVYPYTNLGKVILDMPDISIGETTYVMSDEFYNSITPLPLFDTLVKRMVNKEILSFPDIESVLNTLDTMSPLERFQKIPILITMLKVAR